MLKGGKTPAASRGGEREREQCITRYLKKGPKLIGMQSIILPTGQDRKPRDKPTHIWSPYL